MIDHYRRFLRTAVFCAILSKIGIAVDVLADDPSIFDTKEVNVVNDSHYRCYSRT